jgi:hypothetical protein
MLLKVKDKILNNMCVKLENVEVLYEDHIALGYPCLARIYIKNIDVITTDSSWEQKFSQDPETTYRVITVTGISVSMYAERPE